jgi:hypothetical protein
MAAMTCISQKYCHFSSGASRGAGACIFDEDIHTIEVLGDSTHRSIDIGRSGDICRQSQAPYPIDMGDVLRFTFHALLVARYGRDINPLAY